MRYIFLHKFAYVILLFCHCKVIFTNSKLVKVIEIIQIEVCEQADGKLLLIFCKQKPII